MSEKEIISNSKTPWHLWVVAILAILWNGMGCLDYVMTQTQNEAYMSQFSEEQLAYFYSFPSWVVAIWALAVWGALLGSFLLLFKKAIAKWIFIFSTLCFIATVIQNYIFSNGMKVVGDVFSLTFSAVIFIAGVLLIVYSDRMVKKSILK